MIHSTNFLKSLKAPVIISAMLSELIKVLVKLFAIYHAI
jgi:hypothetical protein